MLIVKVSYHQSPFCADTTNTTEKWILAKLRNTHHLLSLTDKECCGRKGEQMYSRRSSSAAQLRSAAAGAKINCNGNHAASFSHHPCLAPSGGVGGIPGDRLHRQQQQEQHLPCHHSWTLCHLQAAWLCQGWRSHLFQGQRGGRSGGGQCLLLFVLTAIIPIYSKSELVSADHIQVNSM